MSLDDYEEGVLVGKIEYRKYWWEFWKPKYIKKDIGRYTRIGNKVQLNIKFGDLYISGTSDKGLMSGIIKGLPNESKE